MIPWNPHTHRPQPGATAIIATPPGEHDDPDAGWMLAGRIYMHGPDGWISEDGGSVPEGEFWWCAEDDLIAHLMPLIATQTNGHGGPAHENKASGPEGTDMPERVQLSRAKGWKMPANTVKVDRSTRWGNPNMVITHGYAGAVRRFEAELRAGILRFSIDDVRRELRGKNLACWCKPGVRCHADVLLRVANETTTDVPGGDGMGRE